MGFFMFLKKTRLVREIRYAFSKRFAVSGTSYLFLFQSNKFYNLSISGRYINVVVTFRVTNFYEIFLIPAGMK